MGQWSPNRLVLTVFFFFHFIVPDSSDISADAIKSAAKAVGSINDAGCYQSQFFFYRLTLSSFLLFVAAFCSQFKSTIFRQSSPISHWLVSKGVLRKLRLDDKKKFN